MEGSIFDWVNPG